MSCISIPYALGNFYSYSFKSINSTLFETLKQTNDQIVALNRQIYIPNMNKFAEIQKTCDAVMEKHNKLGPQYEKKVKELDDLKRDYFDVFWEGEQLNDFDYKKLSWGLGFSDRYQDKKKHQQKYKHIYDKLYKLQKEIHDLKPYSKQEILTTLNYERRKTEEALERKETEQLERWHNKKKIEYDRLQTIMKPAQLYQYLIKNLMVYVNQSTCTITGKRIDLRSQCTFEEYFSETIINRQVQIIR